MPTSLGPAEIMVILVVALIVLGPKRLPEAGRQVGKAIAEVRKWSQSFQDEIKSVVDPVVKAPSYSDPQPGYQPPIPVIPAQTAPPSDVTAAPPSDVNGSGTVTTGSHGEVSGSVPADAWPSWPAEPAEPSWPAEPAVPSEPTEPPTGEPPRT